MSLEDQLGRHFGGELPRTPDEAVRELKARDMSNRKIGRELGVDEASVRRWLRGATPKGEAAERLGRYVREQRVAAAPAEFRIKFEYDGRLRNLTFRTVRPDSAALKLQEGTVESVQRAYEAGDRAGMARAFIGGVADGFYHDVFEQAHGSMADGGSSNYNPSFA